MDENKKWYAIYTRQGRERKVAESLTRKKIENYCPLNRIARPWGDPKKLIHEPLFPSNIFVQTHETKFSDLLHSDGVISLLCWLGEPAVISSAEIESIRTFLSEYPKVRLEKVGIRVTTEETITDNLTVPAFTLSPGETPRLMLPSLGCLLLAVGHQAEREIIFRNLTEVEAQAG